MTNTICSIRRGNPYQSPVPDLLFDEICDARVDDIRPYLDDPESVDGRVPLHRVTVFLTYRCNLDCPYCKTIARTDEERKRFPQKNVTFTYETFVRYIETFEGTPVEHLHFTGGEAALVKNLPAMVRRANDGFARCVSITSNGTLPLRVYKELVDNGIDEIRISCDAGDPPMGDSLTGRRGTWFRTVRTIRELADYRDAGNPFFLIVNTVVGRENRYQIDRIVKFFLALKPDDMKLITEVDEKECLGQFEGAENLLANIRAVLSTYPSNAFPLLRRKIRTVFNRECIGLEKIARGKNWRCYIPLTERTVDGVYYYPCSVYLREGGKPLGCITECHNEQRRKISAFVRNAECQNDDICRRFCLHCTKKFNEACNDARRGS